MDLRDPSDPAFPCSQPDLGYPEFPAILEDPQVLGDLSVQSPPARLAVLLDLEHLGDLGVQSPPARLGVQPHPEVRWVPDFLAFPLDLGFLEVLESPQVLPVQEVPAVPSDPEAPECLGHLGVPECPAVLLPLVFFGQKFYSEEPNE